MIHIRQMKNGFPVFIDRYDGASSPESDQGHQDLASLPLKPLDSCSSSFLGPIGGMSEESEFGFYIQRSPKQKCSNYLNCSLTFGPVSVYSKFALFGLGFLVATLERGILGCLFKNELYAAGGA